MKKIISNLKSCNHCDDLPLGPAPVFQIDRKARVLIIGQAPGVKAHESGIPWNDASGERLREWMGLDSKTFYNKKNIAIIPMGMCYPGKGEKGDLPPRKDCYTLWHDVLINQMPDLELTLLIGNYAQAAYLKHAREKNLTDTVKAFEKYGPHFFPLPHPSPLNNIWLSKNEWFEESIVPELRLKVAEVLSLKTSRSHMLDK
jgi:uracil-DNA glycosylase